MTTFPEPYIERAITFQPDNANGAGKQHITFEREAVGTVYIDGVNSLGEGFSFTIPADEWERIVAHVKAPEPKRSRESSC